MKKVYNLLKRYYIFSIVILLMGSTTGAFAQPSANAGPDKTICENKTLTLTDATASGYDALLWETDGDGTFGPNATVLNPVYYPGATDAGSVELTLTASLGGSDAIDAMILVIRELPVPLANGGLDATVCNGNNFQISGSTITGGTYTYFSWNGGFDGVFVSPTDLNPEYQPGAFDLLNGEVTLNLNVQPVSPCVSIQVANFVLTFSDEISADAGSDGTICANETFPVSGETTNATSYLWSTDGGDGTFDDPTALSTTYNPGSGDITAGGATLVLTADNLYCDPFSDELDLTINALPGMTCPDPFDVCVSSDPITLTGGLPAGGTYSGTGVSGGAFDPSVGADTYEITYSYTDPGTGCSNECTFEITVNALPIVSCPADDAVCEDASAFDLTGATPAGGDYSGTGVDANSFDPAVAGVGTHTITYVYTDPVTSCTDSCDFNIEVKPIPVVDAGDDQTVCEGVIVNLDAQAEYYDNVLWFTISGDGTFDPSPANTLDPTYEPGFFDKLNGSVVLFAVFAPTSPCVNSITDTVTITFTKPPVADAGTGGTICEDGSFELSGSVQNACDTLWISDDPTGVFDDATSLTANYTPGDADIAAGFATLSLVAYACDPCQDADTSQVVVYIQKNPAVDILFEKDTVCENTEFDFAGKVSYSDKSAVTWYTENGSNNWDNNNIDFPKYTVSQFDAIQGVITIIVTVSPIDPCSVEAVDSCKLFIQPLPVVKAGVDKTVCEDASIKLSDASVLFSNDVLWTTDSNFGSFDDATLVNATYTPGPLAIQFGGATLTLTAEPIDPCTSEMSDELTIFIQNLPVVNAGDDATICEDATHEITASVTGACGSPTSEWTTSGTGTFDAPNDLTTTYNPSQADIDAGSVYLKITGMPCSPCVTEPADSLLLTIQSLPDVDAGIDQTVCEDETVYLDGTISNECSMQWSTFGDGDFNDINIEDPEYEFGLSDIQNGSVKLLFAGGSCSPCATGIYDTVLITIQLAPVADAGDGGTICEDGSFPLSGSVENASGQTWSVVFGGGTFDDAGSLNAEYTPGAEAILAGYAELKLKANPIGPCQNADSSNVIIVIQNSPTVDILFETDTVCQNTEFDFAGKVDYTDKSAVVWYTDEGSNNWDDNTVEFPKYTVSQFDAIQGVITIIVTVSAIDPCTVQAVDSCKLYIQPLPVVKAGVDKTVCEDASITLSDASVLFSNDVLWSTDSNFGSFDDATLVNATYTPGPLAIQFGGATLTLTAEPIDPCTSEMSDELTIFIQNLPVVNAGDDTTICEDATHEVTATVETACGSPLSEWTTSGTGTFDDPNSLTTTYNPSLADIDAGSVYLIITGEPCSPCVDAQSDSLLLTIQLLPWVNAGDDEDVCESGFFLLEATATNYHGILWTTDGDGDFDDDTDLNPIYYPGTGDASLGTVTLTVEVTAIDPCTLSDSDEITLSVTALPVANAGDDDTACETGYTFQSGDVSATSYSNIEWTSNGDGTFDGPTNLLTTYYPGTGDIASELVTLTLVANPINPCVLSHEDDMNLVIIKSALVDAGDDATICDTDTYELSGATASDYSALLWSTDGDGTFEVGTDLNPTYYPGDGDIADGEIELCLDALSVNPCTATPQSCMLLTIQPSPVVDAGGDATLCETGGDVTGTASNESSVEWTSAGDGTFVNDDQLTATYYPGADDLVNGTVELTLTAHAILPCTLESESTITITIQSLPTANAGNDKTLCENGTYTLSGSVTNACGTLWESAGDGGFDNATLTNAKYTPGPTDILNGSVELTLTAYSCGPCDQDDSDNMMIYFQNRPEAYAGEDATLCEDAIFMNDATVDINESLLWTTSGTGTFSPSADTLNPQYWPSAADIAGGYVTLTITATPIHPCNLSTSDDVVITIEPNAVVGTLDDATICEDDTYEIPVGPTPLAENYSTLEWSTTGTGTFSPDNATMYPTYTPSQADIDAGSVDLCITVYPIDVCVLEPEECMTLTIQKLPTVFAGDDDTSCGLDAYPLTDATAFDYLDGSIKWTTSGDGNFVDNEVLNTTYNPGPNDLSNASVTLTVQVSPISPCVGAPESDQLVIYIQPKPTADAGADATICENESYELINSSVEFADGQYWTGGDGEFTLVDSSSLHPTYTPGIDDIANGSVELCLIAKPISPCTINSLPSCMTLTINVAPTVEAGDDATICEDDSYYLSSASATDYSTVTWSGGTGSFDNINTPNATYNAGAGETGDVVLTLTAQPNSPCSASVNDFMTLTINSLPELTSIDLQATFAVDPPDYFALSGDLVNGYGMCIDGMETSHYWLDVDALVATHDLEIDYFNPFFHTATVPGDFEAYWIARGVVSGATGWQGMMYDIITGNEPIFYLVYDGADYILIDGLQYQLTAAEVPLTIPGNYPQGLYEFAGTVKDINGCVSNEITVGITFGHAPVANAGNDATICENDTYELISATVTNASGQFWTGGDGTFSDNTALNPTFTPSQVDIEAGSVDLCLVAEPVTPCEVNSEEDCMTLTIQKLPTVDAGDDATSCALAPYPLVNAEAFDYLTGSVKWTTSGDGTFDDDEDLNTTYNPGTTDFGNSSVTLTVQVSPISPCVGAPVSDEIVIFIQQEVAVIFANEDGQFYQNANLEYCFDDEITITLDEIVTGVAPFDITWDVYEGVNVVSSGSADGINLHDSLFSATYDPGTYTVKLTSLTDVNGCSPSDISIYTMNLVVTPEPTLAVTLDGSTPAASTEYCYDDSFEICLTGVDGTADWTVEWAVTGPSGPFTDVMTGTSECFQFNAADFLPGTYNLTIVSLTDANDCAASQTTLDSYAFQIVILPEPTLEITLDGDTPAASTEYCYDDSFEICLTGVDGTADWTVEWAVTGPSGPFTDVMTGASECFPFNAADFLPGTYELTVVSLTDAKDCAASQATLDSYAFQIVINAEPTLAVTLDGSTPAASTEYCYDDSFEICLTGVDGTADWTVEWAVTGPSGPFTDVMTGTSECFPFNAADFLPGTYNLTIVSLTDAKDCAASQTTLDSYAFQIVILPEPTLEVTLDGDTPAASTEYCYDDSFEICLTGVDGTADWTVEWAVTGPSGPFTDVMTGTSECFPFNAADFLPGTYELTVVSLTDAKDCAASQATLDSYAFQIVINPEPTLAVTLDGSTPQAINDICFADDFEICLTGVDGTADWTVEWAVTGPSGPFTDVMTGTSECFPFNASDFLPGTYELTVVSLTDAKDCAASQATLDSYAFQIVINPEPAIIFANNDGPFYEGATLTYCEGENILITLNEVVSGLAPFNVTWELNGDEASATGLFVDDTLFYGPKLAGTYSIQVTSIVDANTCSPADLGPYNATLVVGPPPALIFAANTEQFYEGAELKYCEGTNIVLTLDEIVLGVAPFNVSWTVNGDPFSANGIDVGYELFNGVKPVGSYDLAITSIVDANGCSPLDYSAYNANIEVVAAPEVYAGENATICEGENFLLSLATVVGSDLFSWSTNGNGEFTPSQINVEQPTYVPDATDVGQTITLFLVAQPNAPCTSIASDFITLFIQPTVIAYAGEDATICEDEMFELVDAQVAHAASFVWSTTGNGAFSDTLAQNPTYDPTLDIGTTVTLCLTAQPIDPCNVEAESCLDLVIQPKATAYAGKDITICEGQVLPLSDAIAENYSTLMWTHNGAGAFDNPGIVNPTYIPANGEVGTITLTLEAQPLSSCQYVASDNVTLYIQPAPYAYAGEDATICEGENLPLNNATGADFMSSLWSSNGDGTFSNPVALFGVTYYPGASDLGNTVTIYLTVQPVTPCDTEAQDSITLFVQPQATAFAGNDATIQSNETYQLNEASATNYGGLLWETSGDGTFDPDDDVIHPTYVPGVQDIIDGEVVLYLTAIGVSPCANAMHSFLLTIEGIPPTVEITSPLDGAFFAYSPVLVEGTAADEDGTIAFVEVRVNGGAWQLATGAEVWSIEVQLDPCLNIIEARATDSQFLQSEHDTVVDIKLNGQLLELKQGWSYISSYIEAADPSFFTLEDYILPLNNVVIMLNDEGKVFWPSEGINTLGDWNNQDGYKVKSNFDGSWLLAGDNTQNQTITLNSGANILPVLTNVDYPMPGDFDDDDILIIFELQTSRIYWPDGELYTLTELKPGFGYLGNFYNSFSITYPDYVDCDLKSNGSEIQYLTNESPWQLERTANVHLISVSGDAVAELDNPQFIGAFDANGMCIGYADVREKADNYLLVLYGDEQSTGEKDGALIGEAINLVAYNGVEEAIVATYDMSMPNFDGNYASNGLSKISSFKSSTGIGHNADVSELIRVFPNPASDMVSIFYPIDGAASVNITFTNASGSVVMTEVLSSDKAEIDISNLQPGVYFVKFESKGSVSVKRLVVK